MNRNHREAVRAFRKAGLDVEVEETTKHFVLRLDGEIVHMLSQGTKQTWRADADIRRKIRRIKEGRKIGDQRFNRN